MDPGPFPKGSGFFYATSPRPTLFRRSAGGVAKRARQYQASPSASRYEHRRSLRSSVEGVTIYGVTGILYERYARRYIDNYADMR